MTRLKQMDTDGKLYIPREMRQACGWEDGEYLEVECDGETVTLRRWDQSCDANCTP